MPTKTKKRTPRLPAKFYKLIRIALADLEKCEKNPLYRIDMGAWHQPEKDWCTNKVTSCAVCFAGSVMAQTLKTPPSVRRSPLGFNEATENKLEALNTLRYGDTRVAVREFYGWTAYDKDVKPDPAKGVRDIHVPEYRQYGDDNKQFKAAMNRIADRLEKLDV